MQKNFLDDLQGTVSYCKNLYNSYLGSNIEPSMALCIVQAILQDFPEELSVVRGNYVPIVAMEVPSMAATLGPGINFGGTISDTGIHSHYTLAGCSAVKSLITYCCLTNA